MPQMPHMLMLGSRRSNERKRGVGDELEHLLEAPRRSRVVLLENGNPLWLRHAAHHEIRTRGLGAYSHWKDRLILSTSDNSNPNTNQRTYQIAFAK